MNDKEKYTPYENIKPIEPPKYRGLLDMETGTLTFYRDDENGSPEFFNSISKLVASGEITIDFCEEIPTSQIVANGELYPGEFDDPLAEEGSDKE